MANAGKVDAKCALTPRKHNNELHRQERLKAVIFLPVLLFLILLVMVAIFTYFLVLFQDSKDAKVKHFLEKFASTSEDFLSVLILPPFGAQGKCMSPPSLGNKFVNVTSISKENGSMDNFWRGP